MRRQNFYHMIALTDKFKNSIESASLIICPSFCRDIFLKYRSLHPYTSFKLMSKDDLKESLTFSVKPQANIYLYRKGYSFDEIEELLKNLYFLKNGISDKIDALINIYKELKETELIVDDPLFKKQFKNSKVMVYGYSKNDIELNYLFDILNASVNYFEDEERESKKEYRVFSSIDEELRFVFGQINELLENGVSLNDIGIYRLPSNYRYPLEKMARISKLPIDFEVKYPVSSIPSFKSITDIAKLSDLQAILSDENIHNDIKRFLINEYHKIIDINPIDEEFRNYIIYRSKKSFINGDSFRNAIRLVNAPHQCKFNFILGFTLENFPKVVKDDDYLNDVEKHQLNLLSSDEKTKIDEEEILNFINYAQNVYISFSEKIEKQVNYPSLLVQKLALKIIKENCKINRYSKNLLDMELASYLDLYHNYHIENEKYRVDENNLPIYRSYSHAFKCNNELKDDSKIFMSYTKINRYNQCAFSYFAERVLKLVSNEETFSLKLGNLFHKVLEMSEKENIDFDDLSEFLNLYNFKPKELILLKNLLPLLKEIYKNNQDFKSHSSFTEIECERELLYQLDDKTFLNGKIDRIAHDKLYDEMILIDYKTGSFNFNILEVSEGFSLQLPLYLLLAEQNYQNIEVVGLYIKTILSSDYLYKHSTSFMSLNGLTIEDENVLSRLDDTYLDSQFIKGLGPRYSKLVSKETLDGLKKEALHQLKKTVGLIREGRFDINPKRINNGNLPCAHCPYSDLCFHDSNDTVYINLKKEENEKVENDGI